MAQGPSGINIFIEIKNANVQLDSVYFRGKGTKLDNLIQVGHDTIIGEKCLIASQSGIAGCCIIEDEVTIWGQVGTNSGITIGAKAVILGQTGVTKSIEGGKTYFGTPIEESRAKLKELALLRKLPAIIKDLK